MNVDRRGAQCAPENVGGDTLGAPALNTQLEDFKEEIEEYKNSVKGEERSVESEVSTEATAIKHDEGKQPWYALPLDLLKPLADVFTAGERKYTTFNCLKPMPEYDRRLWNATLRHLAECQINPLSVDDETGCYHAAQAAFNILLRVYQAQREQEDKL